MTSSSDQDQGKRAVNLEKIPKIKSNIKDYEPHKVLQTQPLTRTSSTYVISTNYASKNVPNTLHKILHPTKVNPANANCKIHKRTRMKSNPSHMKTAHGTSNIYKCQNCDKIFTTKYSWLRHAQIHKNCISFKVYIPAKLDTKPYNWTQVLKITTSMNNQTGQDRTEIKWMGTS